MESKLEEIREQQKASWNKFSSGWKKWDGLMMDFLKPMGDQMIALLGLKDNDRVLDIAAGTGEPGLTIAGIITNGSIVITDLADEMLVIARQNAQSRGINNVEFLACDVSELPFPDNSFDVVSCRLGFMFFPDMLMAAKEMYRVLKPGGRIVTSVWDAAEKNFWVTAISGVINRNMQLSPPLPGAPGMFRCAAPGLIEGLFGQAGLKNITIHKVTGELKCVTAQTYWNMMTEVAAPFVAALSNADNAMREKIKKEVLELVSDRYPENGVMIEGNSLVIYGEK
ncbi:class I SAM-dependent methyltransferase [Flavobacterium silvaticum]|uniref:Class I SAM-dependent methyltransferase n=1 Tax=Flavobacterium silvaticum TaxID=1852020 RepID=A0A972FTJ0_9FLAO|nr:class I SAM-dependent methyltransferase [Flavobacterium silvaticum]NMH27727.1 class I SAM-dependent methyltransferase [Flavobacterium silvaticum]